MTSSQQIQLEKRGIFEELAYSVARNYFEQIGVEINGKGRGDIQIKNNRAYYRMFQAAFGIDTKAFHEAYMDGDWDTDDLPVLIEKMARNLPRHGKSSKRVLKFFKSISTYFFNLQTKLQSKKDISAHYDIGNDLFKFMLDRSMNYSCGYWQKNVFLNSSDNNNNSELKVITNTLCESLDEAQLNKMHLIAKKLHLKPGMKVLDIGCGWGYLAKFLAINFDVHVVGITISEEQIKYATSTDLKSNELEFLRLAEVESNSEGKFEFHLIDYRDVDETFDRIVSVGMIEHVGEKNYDEFFTIAQNCLKDDGLFLLHTIGLGYHQIPNVEKWTNKYIFPGGSLPYHTQLVDATLGKFLIEDWHNLGVNYSRTLNVWRDNFEKSWPQLKDKYGERFKKMWTLYLVCSSVGFKVRMLQLWQIVFSKRGLYGAYVSYR